VPDKLCGGGGQLFTSLLRFGSGWFANHALQLTAATFGVRAPDIDDGGELERGDHQIHRAIKNCDPFNLAGPGLPPHGN